MPLAIGWSAFCKENFGRESDNYGVFEMRDFDDALYIGEVNATNLFSGLIGYVMP